MEEINTAFNKPKSKVKIIFIILAVAVLAEVIYAVRTLTGGISTSPLPSPRPVSTTAAVSLDTNMTEYKVGDTIPVRVIVDTGGHRVAGADILLNFDPAFLTASTSAIEKGTAIKDYPFLGVDPKGTVTVSGISPLKEGNIAGKFTLATINFTAKAKGQTSVSVNFEPNSTTDSNLVESGTNKDILEEVENRNLTIK